MQLRRPCIPIESDRTAPCITGKIGRTGSRRALFSRECAKEKIRSEDCLVKATLSLLWRLTTTQEVWI